MWTTLMTSGSWKCEWTGSTNNESQGSQKMGLLCNIKKTKSIWTASANGVVKHLNKPDST